MHFIKKKSLISLTIEGINQKSFGVKPQRLDPGLTTVVQCIGLQCTAVTATSAVALASATNRTGSYRDTTFLKC